MFQRSTIGREQQGAITGLPLEPDCLLAVQWFGQRGRQMMPEEHLQLAVLEDALARIRQAVRNPDNLLARYTADEVWAWIDLPGDAWPFAFEAICDRLGFSAESLRRGLRQYGASIGPTARGKRTAVRSHGAGMTIYDYARPGTPWTSMRGKRGGGGQGRWG